ncbi:phosphatidate cytidylyltransferase [Methylophaga sp. OBS1]|uniref:phosphatidate cytidylyltransferase n=1 Tax=Methylophaga sp. OBS1 TaxID=2991933 RepID=UPI00224E6ED4|nr:phosphatidate cytidylyltransferase [Methylophaga sp. OBS1]MCX4193355.1 phosphatidate cytidylyltransferase [Methylophaga sp. OBS1]
MLKQRLITAAILIPLVVWALLGLQSGMVTLLFVAISLLAAWEWLSLARIDNSAMKAVLLSLLFLLGGLAMLSLPVIVILSVSLFVWLSATLLVLFFANKPLNSMLVTLFQSKVFVFIVMLLVLTTFVTSAGLLHSHWQQGPALVLYLLVTVWLADSGGYFAGKRFGRHKLAAAISPNKTWEGVYGALALALIWAVAFHFVVGNPLQNLLSWLLLTGFIVMISIVGDLLESVFKRSFQVKDSGQLLPGHGGMLDRIDSLLAALPIFTTSLLILGAG